MQARVAAEVVNEEVVEARKLNCNESRLVASIGAPVHGAAAQSVYPARPCASSCLAAGGGTTSSRGRFRLKLSNRSSAVRRRQPSGRRQMIGIELAARSPRRLHHPDGREHPPQSTRSCTSSVLRPGPGFRADHAGATLPNVLCPSSLPVNRVRADRLRKGASGRLNFASAGIGTPAMSIELLKSMAGSTWFNPVQGTAPAWWTAAGQVL